MSRAWIAFGANLGDRRQSFQAALRKFGETGSTRLVRGSRVYETEPVGPGEQDKYWNAVLEVETSLTARELLNECLRIETDLGRVRVERWGPRVMDLDLLLYNDLRVSEEGMEIPHPRLTERNFVLIPLADLIPAVRIEGRSVAQWLELCEPLAESVVCESLWPWR